MFAGLFVTSAILAIVVWTIERIRKFWRRRQLAELHECEAPPKATDQGFLGISFLKASYESIQNSSYLETARTRFCEYGNTYEFQMAGSRVINTIEPENVRTILSSRFNDFSLGPRRQQAFDPLIGHGIFTADHDWDQQRKLLRPHFSKDRYVSVDALEKHVERLISNIPPAGSSFDLQGLFFKFTIDTATEFLLGQSTESLLSKNGKDEFSASFDRAQRTIADRFALGKLAFFIPQRQFKQDSQYVQQRADEIVQSCLENRQGAEKPESSKEDDHCSFLTELSKVTQDAEILRSAILNLLVAGRDTTASLLSNLWFVLAREPDIWQRLQEEVALLNGEQPVYEQLKDMQYLKHCINESLRLHPPIPMNVRECVNDTVLPVGGGADGTSSVLVRKGDMVGYQVYSMHRQEQYFGPEPETFNPDRWEGLRPGWAYLPFNGGPRLCLGQQYALTEASYLTVRLLQSFSHIESQDSKPWAESLTLSCSSKNGTQVSLEQ